MDVEWLKGEICSRVFEHVEGAKVFTFEFANASIAIDCAWRIVADGHIALAHSDHGQQFGLPAPVDACESAATLLSGRSVVSCQIDTELGDFTVVFSGEVRLDVFNDSSGYEGWHIGGTDGTVLFAASGGEVSSYASEA